MRNKGDFLAGLLGGAVAGAVAALLLTPKSGSEAREFIADRAVRLRERTEGPLSNIRETSEGQISNIGETAEGQISNIGNRVRRARDEDEEGDSSNNLSD